MGTTRNRSFPYENDEFDIPVGTFDEDGRDDEDDTNYGFDDKKEGSDVLFFNFQGGDGNDQFFGGPNDDILKGGKGLDALYGEGGDDYIYGGDGTDWLFGDDGQDHLFGEDGCDQLYGGDNSDVLDGGLHSDWLVGGTGNDVLVGGEGADWLTGGSGYDTFQFTMPEPEYALFEVPDSYAGNPDQITDFSTFDDVIELQGWGISPAPSQYVEGTIDYGAGYDAARTYAETLLNNDNKMLYAFVTDEVDGYLFVDAFKNGDEGFDGLYEGVEVGIKLVGLTDVSNFDFTDIFSLV